MSHSAVAPCQSVAVIVTVANTIIGAVLKRLLRSVCRLIGRIREHVVE